MDVNASTIAVMGLRTRVLSAGETRRGDPIVLIHGVGGWAENWRAVMAPLAATGRRVIAVDLPGFGESEGPSRVSHFGPRDPFYARFMVALLDAVDARSAHLVGNSMGGTVAYMTAVTAPERTRSLSLVAGGGLGTDVAAFLRLATLPGAVMLGRVFGRASHGRDVLKTCFYDARRIPEQLYLEAERYGFASYPEFVRALRSGVNLRGVRRELRAHWIAQAPRYRGAVLVVWGREDAVLPIHHLRDVKEVFSQAEVHIIESCGHLVMAEQPEQYLAATLPFFDRAEAAVAA